MLAAHRGNETQVQYRFTVTTVNELGRSVDSEPSNVARRDEKLPEAWSEHYDEGRRSTTTSTRSAGRGRGWPDNDPLYVDTEVFIQFTPEEMANLRKVYVEVDYDYSGAINRAELESILPKLGERLYQRDIDWLYFHRDDDQSGELDFQERPNAPAAQERKDGAQGVQGADEGQKDRPQGVERHPEDRR